MSSNKNDNSKESFLVERLAQRLGISANATTIYGEPVERGSVTVIPVAKVMYGFGGGSGIKAEEEGSGGGGGVSITPVGYIEINNGNTRFRTIKEDQSITKAIAIGGIFALLTVKSIGSLLKVKSIRKLIRRK